MESADDNHERVSCGTVCGEWIRNCGGCVLADISICPAKQALMNNDRERLRTAKLVSVTATMTDSNAKHSVSQNPNRQFVWRARFHLLKFPMRGNAYPGPARFSRDMPRSWATLTRASPIGATWLFEGL